MMAPIHHNNSTNLSWKNKNHFMKACCHVILTIATCYEDIGMQSDIVAPSNWNKIAVSGSDQLLWSNVKSSLDNSSRSHNSQQSVSSIIPQLLSKISNSRHGLLHFSLSSNMSKVLQQRNSFNSTTV